MRPDRQNRHCRSLKLLRYFCHFVTPAVVGTSGQNPRYEMTLGGTCSSRTAGLDRRPCPAVDGAGSLARNARRRRREWWIWNGNEDRSWNDSISGLRRLPNRFIANRSDMGGTALHAPGKGVPL